MDEIQVQMVGAIFNLAKVNTVHCMFTAGLSLTASRLLESLAHIESITNTYSQ